jgi:ribonucleoside-diphosphate reductase alpha chain
MRNSNTMAIAPTATIANIAGAFPSIEPIYKNMYVKSNFSGEFTIINKYLVRELENLGLWTNELMDKIKYYDGSLQAIDEIPEPLREKYREVFEINPIWIVRHAAHRNKWIDQSQSVNMFTTSLSGRAISEIYMNAWKMGLKTTYYLRTMAASGIEKSTLNGAVKKRSGAAQVAPEVAASDVPATMVKNACAIDDPTCEACQ